ncbi:hypothetical protein Pyn_06085 [Prunus yedoensis var. nudiflora]|uniref:Uncharacterized protein n=1 Tax=Prunus yedoensis var. nudiflora TaxID=2094558 RepID=A0A314Y5G1_PRUYE|nr:hypothetical protein Pyn_06085 [Prunus yedoensis var. nudiflora]
MCGLIWCRAVSGLNRGLAALKMIYKRQLLLPRRLKLLKVQRIAQLILINCMGDGKLIYSTAFSSCTLGAALDEVFALDPPPPSSSGSKGKPNPELVASLELKLLIDFMNGGNQLTLVFNNYELNMPELGYEGCY